MIDFKATKPELELILKICDRLRRKLKRPMGKAWVETRRTLTMDLDACHSNGCPLDFKKMLAALDGDFFHDLNGIQNCLSRNTGKLTGIFHPRCAR